jgi:hypothetical protein
MPYASTCQPSARERRVVGSGNSKEKKRRFENCCFFCVWQPNVKTTAHKVEFRVSGLSGKDSNDVASAA